MQYSYDPGKRRHVMLHHLDVLEVELTALRAHAGHHARRALARAALERVVDEVIGAGPDLSPGRRRAIVFTALETIAVVFA